MLNQYQPNAGQTMLPAENNNMIRELDFIPVGPPDTLLPITLEMKEEFLNQGYIAGEIGKQEFLPGVSAKMLDWFWANMEKGYYLWAPGAHKSFRWLRSPSEYGFMNSQHEIVEPHGRVMMRIPITRLDPEKWYPFTQCLSHVICEGIYNDLGELNDATIHLYEDVPGGCVHIYASLVNTKISKLPDCILKLIEDIKALNPEGEVQGGQPPAQEVTPGEKINGNVNHAAYETSMWPVFLPTLYSLWENHPDPSQSVVCDLTVEKTEQGSYRYKNMK